jgi:tetratricopeptide (TPR) repeat protein
VAAAASAALPAASARSNATEATPATDPARAERRAVGSSTRAARRAERARKIAAANHNVGQGHRLLARGRLEPAKAAYLKALAVLPDYPRALAGLVRVHLRRRDGAEAVRWAQRLVKEQPNRGNNQLLLGDALALRGDQTRARAAWRRATAYGNAAARKRLK